MKDQSKSIHGRPMVMDNGQGTDYGSGGWAGWRGMKGNKWDNYNSINKILKNP